MITVKPFRSACNCPRGFIYPDESNVIDYNSTDIPGDWWILVECKRCGSDMLVGGEYMQTSYVLFPNGKKERPLAPLYL